MKWVDSHTLEKSDVSHNQMNDVLLGVCLQPTCFWPCPPLAQSFPFALGYELTSKNQCCLLFLSLKLQSYSICLLGSALPLLWNQVERKEWAIACNCFKTSEVCGFFVTRHGPNSFEFQFLLQACCFFQILKAVHLEGFFFRDVSIILLLVLPPQYKEAAFLQSRRPSPKPVFISN